MHEISSGYGFGGSGIHFTRYGRVTPNLRPNGDFSSPDDSIPLRP
jgi:hypothetical protein